MIKSREQWKKVSEDFAKAGNVQTATEARTKFKDLRNKVNNRKKIRGNKIQVPKVI